MKLLKQEEIAEMLDVSQATISRMCASNQIPHIILKSGRRKRVIRFRLEEVERWLQSRTHGGLGHHGPKRKGPRIGNGLATEKAPLMQQLEAQRENADGHLTDRLVTGA
jgi:excisionase family DNA binding protein